jgi:hypothetical protein
VELHGFVVEVGLADEEVRLRRDLAERGRPLRITGVSKGLPRTGHTQRVRRRAAGVEDRIRGHAESTQLYRCAIRKLDKGQVETLLGL